MQDLVYPTGDSARLFEHFTTWESADKARIAYVMKEPSVTETSVAFGSGVRRPERRKIDSTTG